MKNCSVGMLLTCPIVIEEVFIRCSLMTCDDINLIPSHLKSCLTGTAHAQC